MIKQTKKPFSFEEFVIWLDRLVKALDKEIKRTKSYGKTNTKYK